MGRDLGRFGAVLAASLVALAAWSAPAWAQVEQGQIALAKVPAAARGAAIKAVPGLKLKEAYQEVEAGKIVYALGGEDAQGRDIEVEVTPEGRVLSVSVEIPLKSVPRVVSKALIAKVKGFRPTSVMAVTENGKIVEYSFEGKDARGEDIEVLVSADGTEVEIDDE